MPPGPPKPPGAICADADAREQPAPRRRRARRCDGAGDRSRVRPRVGPFAQLEQHAAGRGGMQERDLVAARARARRLVDQTGRPPPSAWPARRSGRRPRSRHGAGRDRGSRGNASAPRCRRARRSRRRPRCPPRRSACRNATSVSCPATVSRAPVASPNKVDRLCAAASRSATATATWSILFTLIIGVGDGAAGPELRGNLPGTLEGLQMIEILGCVLRPDTRAPRVAPPVAPRVGMLGGAGMTALARLAGQLLSVGFEGTAAGDELRARIAALGGRRRDAVSPEHRRPGPAGGAGGGPAGGGPGRLAAAGVDRPGGGPGAAAARARDRMAADAGRRQRR